jgi:hypothetical protein
VGWRLEQAEEFREEVEHYTDAERVVLADAYALVLPTVVVGYQALGDVIVVQAADIIRRP